ncbi:MAG TPA: hypothetical protein V6C72_15780, partial [Chroococcales cyanobacterium]
PPRKKWVDFSMDQLQKLLGLLKDESMELLPSGQAAKAWLTSEMKAQIEVLQDADKELDGAYKDLQSITQAPPYSNDGICKGADRLKEVTSGMNQCRKRIMKLLK